MAINDNNNRLGRSCDRLGDIASKAREQLILQNVYQDLSGKRYNSTHPNATQAQGGIDDRLNAKGKGTGEYLDTSNGGGSIDINGRPELGGGGRLDALTKNIYTKDNPYDCFIF
jgi:hypothetical protein